MFYVALLLLILLGGATVVIIYQNFATLLSGEHLLFLMWHLPGIPVLLLCLLGAFLGGLLLYVFSAFSARRDAQEIKRLRVRIEELEKAQVKSPSGALLSNVVPPPVVPIPGFSMAGPFQTWQAPPNQRPPFTTTGPLQPGPRNTLSGLSPSSSALPNIPPFAQQLPPLQQQSDQRGPFQRR